MVSGIWATVNIQNMRDIIVVIVMNYTDLDVLWCIDINN